MPTGYAGEGKTYSKKEGRWVKKETEKAFDYENVNPDSAGLLISFFRYYPDYFADLCRSETATYGLELPQRLMLRIDARYKDTYITGCRGLTKTYIKLLGKMIKGMLYPGIIMRYAAPNQKQAAALAAQAFHQIEKDYPLIAAHWQIRNDRQDMFRISTIYGSEFSMYAPRGDNCSETIAEEIGQEGKDGFDMESYERNILPTCRLDRMVNQEADPYHINQQHSHISNACSKQNKAYTVHRAAVLKAMLYGDEGDGYVIDFSWITALMGGLRNINYIKDMKSKLTANDWLREMCAIYTGSNANPMIEDETLAKSKKIMVMEEKHSGNPEDIYIVAHDVSYAAGAKNAECADVVLKLTKYDDINRRDKYRKQVVYVDSYPPPASAYLQAQKLKELWLRYCLDGGNTTYLVIDAQAFGSEIVEELMKPTTDGTPPLSCINHLLYQSLEQPNALPVIYPIKAGTRGVRDEDGEMIQYAQMEFERGYVELLTGNVLDGIEAYKDYHGIKDNFADRKIKIPYDKTDLLCQQIANLQAEVSGTTLKEKRKSKAIQRDIWSALKYALRMAKILEAEMKNEKYKAQSSWAAVISGELSIQQAMPTVKNTRANLLSLRKMR